MHHRIGEFASLTGLSVKTLRFYDEIGLWSRRRWGFIQAIGTTARHR